MGYIIIGLKSITVYFFIIAAIRIFGKKELSQLNVIDLVFVLLISNAVQNAMVGPDNSLLGGLAAAASLFIANYLLKLALYKYPLLNKLLEGEPLMLIYEGHVIQKNLDRAKIGVEELIEAIREHGVKNIDEVNLAVLESDGNISILSNDYSHKTSKKRKAHKILTKNQ